MEGQDRTHVDPLVTLSLVAGVTERIILGTGSLIPHRHPIHTALLLSSLEHVAGPGRVIAGWGLGTFQHEFDACGIGEWDRRELLPEQIEIMRQLWTGREISFEGKFYSFEDVDIHPSPAAPGSIPIYYCGNTLASISRAVEYCDGWMPGRITFKTFGKRVERMRQLADAAGKPLPTPAAIPITSPGRSREEGQAQVNWHEMMGQAIRQSWENDTCRWEQAEDLAGALIAGSADDIVADTRRYQQLGLCHIVYDLRFRFADWDACLQLLGEEVLPRLRAGD
jgi:alkanesulfonate monooxygenase SsuD/methylene tetrahydromethanopterin reductase-like flavin-dependent oxidoreductase (luciferase family)